MSYYTDLNVKTLVKADYAETSTPPIKVTAYDPLHQVVQVGESGIYPRLDGQKSTHARDLILDKLHRDSYDVGAGNQSNRTQIIDNSTSNPFSFKPGERKVTSWVTKLSGFGLPKMSVGSDWSMIIQWKSIRSSGGGSDPYLSLSEADDGIIVSYNSVQYWNSVGHGSKGIKKQWKIAGDFKGHQMKILLDATFASDSRGRFRLLGEMTGDPSKPLRELVPETKLPTLSPNSPGATVSWGSYQETWLPSITRRYWDIEVLS